MIAARVNDNYKEITKVFAGGTVQQEIIKIWSTAANDWVYEATDEISGTLPLTFHADGSALVDYRLYGNTGGVGDRTVQVMPSAPAETKTSNGITVTCDGEGRYSISGTATDNVEIKFSVPEFTIPVAVGRGEQGTFSMFNNFTITPGSFIFYYNGTQVDAWSFSSINKNSTTYSLMGGKKVNKISVFLPMNASINGALSPMLTDNGILPETYVPFGYELDISTSDGTNTTVTPIYIGNDPLEKIGTYSDYIDYESQKVVRAIKKYVLTGKEDWEQITGNFPSRTYFRWVFAPINYCVRHVCTCSHFEQVSITTATTTVGFDVFDSTSVNGEVLAIRPANVQSTTLTDFKAWLAEQYVAGTPVTVWCALTTAEEADPPEPLPALPTVEGNTVIDYDGTPAPSNVYVKYKKGW